MVRREREFRHQGRPIAWSNLEIATGRGTWNDDRNFRKPNVSIRDGLEAENVSAFRQDKLW